LKANPQGVKKATNVAFFRSAVLTQLTLEQTSRLRRLPVSDRFVHKQATAHYRH
jgi:hypothetical protein